MGAYRPEENTGLIGHFFGAHDADAFGWSSDLGPIRSEQRNVAGFINSDASGIRKVVCYIWGEDTLRTIHHKYSECLQRAHGIPYNIKHPLEDVFGDEKYSYFHVFYLDDYVTNATNLENSRDFHVCVNKKYLTENPHG